MDTTGSPAAKIPPSQPEELQEDIIVGDILDLEAETTQRLKLVKGTSEAVNSSSTMTAGSRPSPASVPPMSALQQAEAKLKEAREAGKRLDEKYEADKALNQTSIIRYIMDVEMLKGEKESTPVKK